MPEGPEIRREADAIHAALAGRALTRVEYRVTGLEAPARRLRHASVLRAYSRGKSLLIDFSNGITHYSHNQLYGKWRVMPAARNPEAGRRVVRVILGNGASLAVLYSATQIDLVPTAALDRHPFLAGSVPTCSMRRPHPPSSLHASPIPGAPAARLARCFSIRVSSQASVITSAATSCSRRGFRTQRARAS
jgi:hypothetical protein